MKLKDIKKALSDISFAPSNLDMGWKWQAKKNGKDFKIRCSFRRPDTNTGEVGEGFGRWMLIDRKSDARGVIMTAWVCAKLIVDHELMEAFLYRNVRILDPHKNLEDLGFPHELGTNQLLIKIKPNDTKASKGKMSKKSSKKRLKLSK